MRSTLVLMLLCSCGRMATPEQPITAIASSGDGLTTPSTTCALYGDHTVACIGDEHTVAPMRALASTISDVSALSVRDQLCVVHDGGNVSCSRDGALPLTDAVTVSTGTELFMTCAVRSTGQVACWNPPDVAGAEGSCNLGDGTRHYSTAPVTVSGISNAVDVQVGSDFACALLATGEVTCWGDNRGLGALGNGALDGIELTPVAVAGLAHVVAIAAGIDHVCALRDDGTVACFGALMPEILLSPTPVDIAGVSGAVAISVANQTTCALKNDQTVVCWGENSTGMLGDGTTLETTGVHAVAGVAPAKAVSTPCALTGESAVMCWGFQSSSLAPKRVEL